MYYAHTHTHTPRARVLEGWPKCQPQSASGIVTFKRLTRAEPAAAAAQHEQHQQRPSGSSSQSVELKTKHAQPTASFLHTHSLPLQLTPLLACPTLAPLATRYFHTATLEVSQPSGRGVSRVALNRLSVCGLSASQRLSECCPLWVCYGVC